MRESLHAGSSSTVTTVPTGAPARALETRVVCDDAEPTPGGLIRTILHARGYVVIAMDREARTGTSLWVRPACDQETTALT
jgi:hypothetical protein